MAIPFKYNVRNVRVRWLTSSMTVGGIALVTMVFVSIFALGLGLERTLVSTGEALDLIVLRPAARTEINSSITRRQAGDVAALEGVAKNSGGHALVSEELVVVANHAKRGGGKANVTLRGVGPLAREFREHFKLLEGRWFTPRTGELVIGKGAHARFAEFNVGDTPFIRGRRWTVVGVFSADGQAYESEVWSDVEDLREQFKREYSTLLVRCADEAALGRLTRVIQDDRQIQLEAKRHSDYYQEQTMGTRMLKAMGVMMALVLSIGAIFGAANTMYAAVASRIREIATMRVLGFSRLAIWSSFVLESALLGLLGGAIGSVLAYVLVDGQTTGTVNWETFSEIAFQFRVTPGLMGIGVVLAMLMGMVGGFFPAFRASRRSIPSALRGL